MHSAGLKVAKYPKAVAKIVVGDRDKAHEILGVPDDYEVAHLLGVGYPADWPIKPIRRPL
jgi:hypothetical protein